MATIYTIDQLGDEHEGVVHFVYFNDTLRIQPASHFDLTRLLTTEDRYTAVTVRPEGGDYTYPEADDYNPDKPVGETRRFNTETNEWQKDWFIDQSQAQQPVGVFFSNGSSDFTYNGWVLDHPKLKQLTLDGTSLSASVIPHFEAVQHRSVANMLEASADLLIAIPPERQNIHPKKLGSYFWGVEHNTSQSIRNWKSASKSPGWKVDIEQTHHDYGKHPDDRVGEIDRTDAGKPQVDETNEGRIETRVANTLNVLERIGGHGLRAMYGDLLDVSMLYRRGGVESAQASSFFMTRLNARLADHMPDALESGDGNLSQDFAILLSVAQAVHASLQVTIGGHTYFRKLPNPLPDEVIEEARDLYTDALHRKEQAVGDSKKLKVEAVALPDSLKVSKKELKAYEPVSHDGINALDGHPL